MGRNNGVRTMGRNNGVRTMGDLIEAIESGEFYYENLEIQVEFEQMVSSLSDDELLVLDEGLVDPTEALEWMLQERKKSKNQGSSHLPGAGKFAGRDLGRWKDREDYQKSIHKGATTQDLQKHIHSKSKELKHLARKELVLRAKRGISGPSKSSKSVCPQGQKMIFGVCRKVKGLHNSPETVGW